MKRAYQNPNPLLVHRLGSQPSRMPGPMAVLAALLCLSLIPAASQSQPPYEDNRVPVIDADQFIEIALARPELRIIDSRIPSDRKHGYIEDSINLPDVDTNCDSLARILPSPTTPVVFYCNGPKCNRSAVASEIALRCGYRESYWFRGGFAEWESKGYPTLLD